jgi:hypothetical protein
MKMTAITRIEPAAAPQASTPDAITPMHMLQVAMEKGADLDRLQPWLINRICGTDYPTTGGGRGKNVGWSQWTFGGGQ